MLDETPTKLTYYVVTVEKTNTPDGMTGNNWHRYVIGHGNSRIEGKKPGSLKEVTEHAEMAVEHLNSRNGKKTGSPYSQNNRK